MPPASRTAAAALTAIRFRRDRSTAGTRPQAGRLAELAVQARPGDPAESAASSGPAAGATLAGAGLPNRLPGGAAGPGGVGEATVASGSAFGVVAGAGRKVGGVASAACCGVTTGGTGRNSPGMLSGS